MMNMEQQTITEPRTPKFPGALLRGKFRRVDLTPAQEEWLRRYFPIRENAVIRRLTGMGDGTLHRLARRYGLTKSGKGLKGILARNGARIKQTCERNGYYASIRGKRPSEAAFEAYRRKRAAGWHPLHGCTPERLAQIREKRRAVREEALRRDRLRILAGLPQETRLHIPTVRYSRRQACMRSNLRKRGYIPGDYREDMLERYVIYWDDGTLRSPAAESNAIRAGFEFRRLDE